MTKLVQRRKKRISRKSGCKGSYTLRKLPFHNRIDNTPVDPMHLIKNIGEHLVRLVAGIAGIEDSKHVREEEECFRSCWIKNKSDKLPPAPFSLTKTEMICANNRAKSICVPATFDWRPRDLFTHYGMKCHEWKEVICCGIRRFCVVDLLGQQQRTSLFTLFDVVTRLCSLHII